jgi:hypothetical protein
VVFFLALPLGPPSPVLLGVNFGADISSMKSKSDFSSGLKHKVCRQYHQIQNVCVCIYIQNNLLPNTPVSSMAFTQLQFNKPGILRKKVTDKSCKSINFVVPSIHQCEECCFSYPIMSRSMEVSHSKVIFHGQIVSDAKFCVSLKVKQTKRENNFWFSTSYLDSKDSSSS